MGASAAKTQRSAEQGGRRGSYRCGIVAYCLVVGAAATVMAAVFSLLVDGVMAKRVVWLVVTVGVAVGAGVWRALGPLTEHRQGHVRLPPGHEVGSRR